MGWSLLALAAAIVVVRLSAALAWDGRSADLRQTLDRTAAAPQGAFSVDDVTELPAPVERFFRHVLRDGQPLVQHVELATSGEFRTGDEADTWRPFTAWQRFSVSPPGFVWDARIAMAPFMPVYVRDAFVDGHAEMRGKVMGLFPVVDEVNTPGLAAGQLHRYLAETMWFPTALLPGQGVVWQPIDTKSAVATLSYQGTTVALRFLFSPEGDISEVFALDRMRAVNGRQEPTPWAVRCADHQERSGMRIPTWCEAEWRLPSGPLPYWRGRVDSVRFRP
jgi:hypothetical protein